MSTRHMALMSAAVTVVNMTMTPAAHAQWAPAGFLNVNVVTSEPVSTAFSQKARVDPVSAQADYNLGRAPAVDVGGGVLLGPRFGVGLSLSHVRDERPATIQISAAIPDFGPPGDPVVLTLTGRSEPLSRSETAAHVQLLYRLPAIQNLGVTIFGGPSYFRLTQALVSDFDLGFMGPTDLTVPISPRSVVIRDVQTERHTTSVWGYNVGADVNYMLTRSFGLGALIRYSNGTVTVPNLLQSAVSDRTINEGARVGGLAIGAGIRLRF